MALARDIYRELEDILGPENISEDIAILEAYSCYGFGSRGPEPEDRYYTLPEAVTLPANVKEIQAIMKLCNRRGLRCKPSSTGYGPHNAVSDKNTIFLDLRRLNRVIDVDEKNMFAIVEPYVSFAQLQGEAMKKGLNTHVIGAGSNCSALASTTSMHGTNTQAVSHGWGGRNLLGVEWVMSTGEIIHLGAPGSGAGWFSCEGPGPSLRGIMRGHAGAQGGLGVFTKCAIHLHPWPGPQTMEIQGVSPQYEMDIPPLFEYHMIEWPTWDLCAEAQYKIGEAGIAYALHKTGGPGSHGSNVTGCNNEYYAKWNELKGIPWVSYAIVMGANSPEEHEYQEKALRAIVEDTQGKFLPLGENDFFKRRDFITMIKCCFIPRQSFRTAGSFTCPIQGADTVAHTTMGLSFDKELRKKYDDKGLLVNDGVNHMWGVPFDGAHFALFECGHLYSPTEADSWKAGAEMMLEGGEIGLKTPLSIGWTIMGNDVVNKLGPLVGNVQNWQRKIKRAFDPKTASDPAGYISPEETAIRTNITPFGFSLEEKK